MSVRQVVLGFAMLGAGFLAGVSYSLEAMPGCEAPHGANRVDVVLLKRLSDLDALVKSEQAQTRAQIQGLSRGASNLREQVRSAPVQASPSGAPRGAAGAAPARKVTQVEREAARTKDLAALAGSKTDAALRAEWESASVEELRRRLGPPDRVNTGAAGDSMTYLTKDGDRVVGALCVRLAAGRITEVVVESEPVK